MGGVNRWFEEVIPRLQNRGHEVILLITNRGERIHFSPIKCATEKPLLFAFIGALFRLFKEFDLVYQCYTTDPLRVLSTFAEISMKTPLVLGHHGHIGYVTPPKDMENILFKGDVSVFYIIKKKISLRMKAYHHVLNREAKIDLLNHGVKKVFLIPNGVDTFSYTCCFKKRDKFTVLYLSRLEYQKGADFVPYLVQRLTSKNLEFWVSGRGSMEKLISQIKSDKFRWWGYTPEDLKKELLMNSHVAIFPSRGEAFPLTGLEAMASGTPVVTFDIPGPREYVVNGYNGFLVRSLEEMVEKVNKLYSLWKSGSQEYWEMCKNARKTAERFDWAVIIPKLEHMFHTVVKAYQEFS
jgi:glycosyltransferase involved in cell wall biosynthesis